MTIAATPGDPFAPHPMAAHHAPQQIAADTYLIRSMFGEGQGPVAVYVNSMVIAGPEPVVVDTGTVVNRDQWLADVFSIVEPTDIRYVFLSHDDHDHVGNLLPLLEAAPQATVLTTWFSQERLAGDLSIPLDRVRWINDGDTFEAGGRTLAVVRPPLFDAPTSRGLFDPASGVYWAVDTYGVPVPSPVEDVAELDRDFWDEQFVAFNRLNSPWHAVVDPRLFGEEVARIERLGATVLASGHGPAITGSNVAEAHRKMHRTAGGERTPVPTQADLDSMLETLLAPPAAGSPVAA
jgi:flavorubredoxin